MSLILRFCVTCSETNVTNSEILQPDDDDPAIAPPALKVTPAAMRLHHAYRAGLLDHSLSLCELIEMLVRKYPRLNRDWLIAGAILHDIGKVEDLGASRCLGYTTRWQLLGHVALGLEILERHVSRLPAFPVEVKSILQHLIVSHHGEIEKGALRAPMFPEALTLWIADLLDARLEQAWRLIDQGPESEEWTAYVPSLERQLYRWRPLEAEPNLGESNGVQVSSGIAASGLDVVAKSNGHR